LYAVLKEVNATVTVEIAANWIAGQAAVDAAKVAGQKLYYDYARRYYS
jgi:hypothetical protein